MDGQGCATEILQTHPIISSRVYTQTGLQSMAVLDDISRMYNHSSQLYGVQGVQTDLYLSSKDNGISFKIV